MTRLLQILTAFPLLALSTNPVPLGFSYGAFWSHQSNIKKMEDFHDGFNYAKNLSSNMTFDSAGLYSCRVHGTKDEPTGAFDAAVLTKTKLLLGFWITPGKRGDPVDELVIDEVTALGKGFEKHGQALADLILGLSMGSEDIYRFTSTQESGLSAADVTATITKVRFIIAASSFAHYMKGKPIGHLDTAQNAIVNGADFYGTTAYPYWQNETVAMAKQSFLSTLESVQQRADNIPIWIAETGWPFKGPQRGGAVANAENQQLYWKEVGCAVMGKYPTFWFELIKDSTPDQPDWGILDEVTHQPRIKNMNCSGRTVSKLPVGNVTAPSGIYIPMPPGPAPTSSSVAFPSFSSSFYLTLVPSSAARGNQTTIRITETITVTVTPTPAKTINLATSTAITSTTLRFTNPTLPKHTFNSTFLGFTFPVAVSSSSSKPVSQW